MDDLNTIIFHRVLIPGLPGDGMTVAEAALLRADLQDYADQLAAYAMAMERIEGKPVREAVLWYLRRREAVRVPLAGIQ